MFIKLPFFMLLIFLPSLSINAQENDPEIIVQTNSIEKPDSLSDSLNDEPKNQIVAEQQNDDNKQSNSTHEENEPVAEDSQEDAEEGEAVENKTNKKQTGPELNQNQPNQGLPVNQFRRINEIFVEGNVTVPTQAILSRIDYRPGDLFDPIKTRTVIRNLYYDIKRLRNISIYAEPIGQKTINLIVVVQEKRVLKDIIFRGNYHVKEKEIREKTNVYELPAIDPEQLKVIARQIKKIYEEKGYHLAVVSPSLHLDDAGRATITFDVTENNKSVVKKVNFIGNAHISSKELRGVIFTREDWLLSFMDGAGTYQPERFEADKHILEQFYQNRGYFMAKVIDAKAQMDPHTNNFTVTFEIQEGDIYTVKEVKAPGNEFISEEELLWRIQIKPGDIYSREAIVETMKGVENLWGNLGYIFAHVEPSIIPDEETKTVSLAFYSELGNQVYLNRLSIRGNKKTRDKIIRRQLVLEEGDLITNSRMEGSKNRVDSLGYFKRADGVNWKITRLSDDTADLDLMLKEEKTGNAALQLGFGGDPKDIFTPNSGLSVEGNISDTNLFGSGIAMNLFGKLSKSELSFAFNVTEPWLFDYPILASLNVYHKRLGYDSFRLSQAINELDTGGGLTAGFVTGLMNYSFFSDTFFRFNLALISIKYSTPPLVLIPNIIPEDQVILAQNELTNVLCQEFEAGSFPIFAMEIGQNKRNHPIHPSRGYSWMIRNAFAFPAFDSNIGFYKFSFDTHWFTPLIGAYDLIFHLHYYFGFIKRFKGRTVPFRELYHVGGPSSVRGWLYGQIGPQFTINDVIGDSIGANKAMWLNAELVFPITPDLTMKGVLFYDGGTGWDNPYSDEISPQFLFENGFDYRHAVGFGLRLLQPMPVQVYWAFKIDPREDETSHEVHFNMSYDW